MSKAPSIKAKLLRMQLGLATAIIALLAGAFFTNDLLFFRGSVFRHFNSTALILSRNLTAALSFLDREEGKKVLSSLQVEPSIVSASLFDANRKLFASYQNPNNNNSHFDMKKVCKKDSESRKGHFIFYHELAGENPGVLCIEWDLVVLASDYKSYIGIFIAVLFSGLLLSYFLAYWIQRAISKPIIQLAKTTKSISDSEDYSMRMPLMAADKQIAEINMFADEFNKMLDQIQTSNERIQHEKQQAEQANKSKSVFLANISHELRTPMHGILSFARFGQQKIDTVDKERLKSYFDEISDCGARLMSLLNDLLDLSKLEAGKATYNMRNSNLIDVLDTVQSEMQAFAEEKQLKIEISKPNDQIIAEFDPEKILQVLRNIISNAIKFSNEGSTINISVNTNEAKIRCSVSNQGVGIPKDECKAVFDTFTQSSVTRTGAGGTGLGLAICREIVHHHGGEIWVESELGALTTFVFELSRERFNFKPAV